VIQNNLIFGLSVGIRLSEPGTMTVVSNNTITDNDYGIATYTSSGLEIKNCIIWDNEHPLYTDSGAISVTYSCIDDCELIGNPQITHNTCSNPLFVSPGSDYHISSGSSGVRRILALNFIERFLLIEVSVLGILY